MFTKNIKDTFTKDLLDVVTNILGEAKKCPKDCECEKCEKEDEDEDEKEEMKEASKEAAAFSGPYKKKGVHKDEYGNVVKNVAKHLAKTALNKGMKKTNEEVEELDELSVAKLDQYRTRARKDIIDTPDSNEKRIDKRAGGYMTASRQIAKKLAKEEAEQVDEKFASAAQRKAVWATYADGGKGHPDNKKKKMKEEAEQIDELSRRTLGSYVKKAGGTGLSSVAGRAMEFKASQHGSDREQAAKDKKALLNRTKGISKAVDKMLAKEEAEELDEISKATLGSYVNKAAERVGTQGVTAGLKVAKDEKSKQHFDTMAKRQKGIAKAVSKLTKEEQDFIDALNADTLDEGRGRPPKEGSAAWHAKQKEENDDMPALGMQIRKAKSINKPVRFMNGKTHAVKPEHADRFEDHMAARRTTQEKAAFQKQAHKSHEDFVKAVTAPVPKAAKDTGEIVKYRH
jgi:hypothetical protein